MTTNRLGDELTGDDLLIVQAARILERGIGTRSDSDSLSVLHKRLHGEPWTLTKPQADAKGSYWWWRKTADDPPILMRVVKGWYEGKAEDMAGTWANQLEPMRKLGGEWQRIPEPR